MLQIAWCTLYASYSHMLYAHLVCYVVRAHMARACVGACERASFYCAAVAQSSADEHVEVLGREKASIV